MKQQTAKTKSGDALNNSELRARSRSEPYFKWLARRILRVRLAWASLAVLFVVILMAIFAPVITSEGTTTVYLERVLQGPSLEHPMGTDNLGRDVLTRIIYGARVSLSAGLVSTGIGLTIGTFLGVIAGYFVGRTDTVIMRLMDALLAFPSLVLALAITAMLGPSLTNAMVAIGIVTVPVFSRLARAQVLAIKHVDYIEAAHAIGMGNVRILYRHIGPNMMTPIIIQATLSIAFAILTEASLSFLGLGVQPPTPSWGFMLNVGREYVDQAPWLAIFPGLVIFLVVMAFNLLGDAIRDAFDPRLRL